MSNNYGIGTTAQTFWTFCEQGYSVQNQTIVAMVLPVACLGTVFTCLDQSLELRLWIQDIH